MLNRIKLWVGVASALLTVVVLVLTSTGLAGPGSTGDGCQSACENFLAKCTSGLLSSGSSSESSSSSSSGGGGALGACVDACRGGSSSSSSSSSGPWTWSWLWPWSWALTSSGSSSWSSWSSGQPFDGLLTCIATAPTCPAIGLCGRTSAIDGSTVGANDGADGAAVTVPSGTGGSLALGTGGTPASTAVSTGGIIGASTAAPGTGGIASATSVGPAGTGGALPTSLVAPGAGGAIATSGPTPEDPSSAKIGSGGCDCRVGQHTTAGIPAVLFLVAALVLRRRRSQR
jgi:MYXO-CTERM domain-containing protein